MSCTFCEIYNFQKDMRRQSNKESDVKIYNEYTVAMVIRSWTKEKGKRRASRTTDYRHLGIGYKLNFCPECGRCLKCGNF